MDNPVDVAFLPNGERFLTTTFLTHPQAGLRDGLLHAVYGGVYGKDHEPIYSQPWTAPTLMPVLVHMGASASCGLTCYESEVFGAEYRGNLFACHFNLRKVTRHILVAHGAGYTTRDEDFLVCDHLDFHPRMCSKMPTEVCWWWTREAGTNCAVRLRNCPSRMCRALFTASAAGPVLVVRQAQVSRASMIHAGSRFPGRNTQSVSVQNCWAIRDRQCGSGPVAVWWMLARMQLRCCATSCDKAPPSRQRLYAVWTLCQIPDKSAREAIRLALRDRDTDVQRAALHSVALWRDAEALAELRRLVTTADAAVRRVAAEALGRIGRAEAVRICSRLWRIQPTTAFCSIRLPTR
jgi:hypothetical protein